MTSPHGTSGRNKFKLVRDPRASHRVWRGADIVTHSLDATFAALAATLMTMRMTLPDAQTRAAMLRTGMERGMEASYVRLEGML